jgi:hypothetical protein
MKMAVLWVTAPCSLVEVYRRFRGACCPHRPRRCRQQAHTNCQQDLRRYLWRRWPSRKITFAYLTGLLPSSERQSSTQEYLPHVSVLSRCSAVRRIVIHLSVLLLFCNSCGNSLLRANKHTAVAAHTPTSPFHAVRMHVKNYNTAVLRVACRGAHA